MDDSIDDRRALQLQWRSFYVLLGVALLSHEILWYELYVRPTNAGLFGFFERYAALAPLVRWSNVTAGLLHSTYIALAVFLIVGPAKRATACLMLPAAVLVFFIQGPKVPNHYFVLMTLLCMHFTYAALRWHDLWRGRLDAAAEEGHVRFFRNCVLILLLSTYWFAGLAKLNETFLDPKTTAAATFIWRPLVPANHGLKWLFPDPRFHESLWQFYGAVGIVSTFLFELLVPVGLLLKRFRRQAVFALLLFHGIILAVSAMDFSTTCIAMYPIVLRRHEWAEFYTKYLARWSTHAFVVATVSTAYFTALAFRDGDFQRMLTVEAPYRMLATAIVTYVLVRAVPFAWRPRAGGRNTQLVSAG